MDFGFAFAGKILFLTLIAGRKQKDALLTALSQSGTRLISALYGKGSVKSSYLKNVFGLIPEENKVVITCVLTQVKADAVMKILIEKFRFDKPNTGIAFTIPIDSLSF